MIRNYYVYALKDPRQKPAKIFYIGKGTGSRYIEHINEPDDTRKGKYIKEILTEGSDVIITKLVDHLTEEDALCSYSILGLLIKDGAIKSEKINNQRIYMNNKLNSKNFTR